MGFSVEARSNPEYILDDATAALTVGQLVVMKKIIDGSDEKDKNIHLQSLTLDFQRRVLFEVNRRICKPISPAACVNQAVAHVFFQVFESCGTETQHLYMTYQQECHRSERDTELKIKEKMKEWEDSIISTKERECIPSIKEELNRFYLTESTSLKFDGFPFSVLPEIFCYEPFASRLQVFSCRNSQLKMLPKTLTSCSNIREIVCPSNKIVYLPISLGRCINLEILDLENNELPLLDLTFSVRKNNKNLWINCLGNVGLGVAADILYWPRYCEIDIDASAFPDYRKVEEEINDPNYWGPRITFFNGESSDSEEENFDQNMIV